jgi:hypothetical protein
MCWFLNSSVKRAVIALFVSDVLMLGVMMISRCSRRVGCVFTCATLAAHREPRLIQNAHKMKINKCAGIRTPTRQELYGERGH